MVDPELDLPIEKDLTRWDIDHAFVYREFSHSLRADRVQVLLLDHRGVGLATCRCMQASAEIAEVDTNRFRQAVAIAQGQSELSLALPFEKLEPTIGFLPAYWVRQPGYRAGEIPVPVSVSGEEEAEIMYLVTYRSENMDGTGHLRRIAIRVEWDRAGGSRGVYTIDGVRAG